MYLGVGAEEEVRSLSTVTLCAYDCIDDVMI
jgi:hypothetical protein